MIREKQFDTMIQQLIVAGLIQQNGLLNIDGANAYDCSSPGDALTQSIARGNQKQMVGLIAEVVGILPEL